MKKIKNYAKLIIKYKNAKPIPPVSPILGSRGINIMDFCKKFNKKTNDDNFFVKETPVTVIVTIYIDNTFSFTIKTPPTSYLLKNALKITKGSSQPGKKFVKNITYKQLNEIAKIKYKDLNSNTLKKAENTILGSAKSMGVFIK